MKMGMKKLGPKEIKAKMSALEELYNMASDMESDDIDSDLKGIKKITVASNDGEGLEEGLEKAKEIVEEKESPLEDDMMEMEGEKEMSLPEKSPLDSEEEDEDLKSKMKLMKSKKKQGLLF